MLVERRGPVSALLDEAQQIGVLGVPTAEAVDRSDEVRKRPEVVGLHERGARDERGKPVELGCLVRAGVRQIAIQLTEHVDERAPLAVQPLDAHRHEDAVGHETRTEVRVGVGQGDRHQPSLCTSSICAVLA